MTDEDSLPEAVLSIRDDDDDDGGVCAGRRCSAFMPQTGSGLHCPLHDPAAEPLHQTGPQEHTELEARAQPEVRVLQGRITHKHLLLQHLSTAGVGRPQIWHVSSAQRSGLALESSEQNTSRDSGQNQS